MDPHPPTRDGAEPKADVHAPTARRDLRATMVPSSLAPAFEVHTTIDRRLELFDTIGEGGMGIVRRGAQCALGREVAVKGLKQEHRASARAASKLLREARVTGGLQHPNVIPVYEIAEEDDGSPLIVLKKVEGAEWAALMGDAEVVRARFGTDDLLEWNLRILVQVCNAVSFAHSRRVLHRDLKPSNVMIGEFGEVYVLDWGIAVALADKPGTPLPRASEATEMAGTPVYMAPEMLGGRAGLLSERTDIYLLGGILYEIVTGRPPHAGETLPDIVESILGDDPPIPASVPSELSSILERALHRNPAARFERVDALRIALEDFLRHRTAIELARTAEERLSVLLAELEAPGAERDTLYGLYGECRFGLRHALEAWPANDSVRSSLELATTKMVELELLRGEPQAARVLLHDLDPVPAALEARVTEHERRAASERTELRRLRDDLDPSRGRAIRGVAFALLAAIWILYPLVVEYARVTRHWAYTREGWVVATGLVLAVVLAIAWWSRREMLSTAINRRLAVAVVLATGLQLASATVTLMTRASILAGLPDRLLGAAAIVGMLAAGVHWGLLVSAGGYLAAYLVVAWIGVPSVLYLTSAANLILFLNLFVLLARPDRGAIRGR